MDILLVGLMTATADVVARVLMSRGHVPAIAATGADGLEMLARGFPFVVVEDPLADMTGAEFCRRTRAMADIDDPIILVVTPRDEDVSSVLEAGATDLYFTSLGPSALETRLLIAERLVAKQRELKSREVRFRRLFDSGVAGVTIADLDGNFKEANDAFLRMLGYTRAEMRAGKLSWAVITPPEWLIPDAEARAQLKSTGFLPLREREYVHKDGHTVSAQVGAAMLADTGEFVTYLTDLTEKKRAEIAQRDVEDQLRQAQKMEAIGHFASGVAHDFNNMLSVILSYSALALDEIGANEPLHADIAAVKQAGERASDLTRQLLAFSRRQQLAPRTLDLNAIVIAMERMLTRLLRDDIELTIQIAADLGNVDADPGQIEQIVMNLVVNARDAMPNGGKICVKTMNVDLGDDYVGTHFSAKTGPHVMLIVTDDGTGMESATCARIFEPFFTTKGKDHGTGLGLSTVLGIVQQSGGSIAVDSALERGTTFNIFFPRSHRVAELAVTATPLELCRGSETILVAEDEEQVRHAACAILRRNGYHVLEARSGGEALRIADQHPGEVHLLLTDLVMPQMSGRHLVEALSAKRPRMQTLYMSGYGEIDDSRAAMTAVITKPITPVLLLTKLRELLDDPITSPAGV